MFVQLFFLSIFMNCDEVLHTKCIIYKIFSEIKFSYFSFLLFPSVFFSFLAISSSSFSHTAFPRLPATGFHFREECGSDVKDFLKDLPNKWDVLYTLILRGEFSLFSVCFFFFFFIWILYIIYFLSQFVQFWPT